MEGIFPSNMGGNMNAVKEDVEKLIKKELVSANQRFPMFRSDHEGAAVIFEEIEEVERELSGVRRAFGEAWCSVKHDEESGPHIHKLKVRALYLAYEAIQVAAMAQKLINSQKERGKSEGN